MQSLSHEETLSTPGLIVLSVENLALVRRKSHIAAPRLTLGSGKIECSSATKNVYCQHQQMRRNVGYAARLGLQQTLFR